MEIVVTVRGMDAIIESNQTQDRERYGSVICSNCSTEVSAGALICPRCGREVVSPAAKQPKPKPTGAEVQEQSINPLKVVFTILARLLAGAFTICFFGAIIYTAYFWYDNWRINRIYEGGALRAPIIEAITLPYGQKGHSLTFFGNDGDELFVPDLNRSYPFVGGMTQIDIPDSQWFASVPQSDIGVVIPLMPVIFTERNGRIVLPRMDLTIETPDSPLEITEPRSDFVEVDTSLYTLRINVVPGSEVQINGEDQKPYVSHEGLLEANINVRPIGDNPISINVKTAHHREVRRDLILHRAPQTIYLERSLNLAKSTNNRTFTIEGNVAPGANIVVDTDYLPDTLKVDAAGKFSFRAIMTTIGDNVVRWHATMDGVEDQHASYTVYYVPTLNEYGGKAWRLNNQDYDELKVMIEMRQGQPYLCWGSVVDVFVDEEDGIQYIVMDITRKSGEGSDLPHYCVLENRSTVKDPEIGKRYKGYSDVDGSYFYRDDTVPKFVCRYLTEE